MAAIERSLSSAAHVSLRARLPFDEEAAATTLQGVVACTTDRCRFDGPALLPLAGPDSFTQRAGSRL